MTGRERVTAALTFSTPDRAPRDIWALPYISLFRKNELDALLDKFPSDFGRAESCPGVGDDLLERHARPGSYVDEWGCVWELGEPGVAGEIKNPIPIYIRLRDISAEKSLMDLIEKTDLTRKTPKGYFERLLNNGKCVVLLDGLDEVLDQDHHLQVVKEIKQLTHDHPKNWFIITCRIAGWQDQLPNFRLYEVRPLADEEIRSFINAWYREVYRSNALDNKGEKASEQEQKDAEEKALKKAKLQSKALWRSLRQNSGLLKIARKHLILS